MSESGIPLVLLPGHLCTPEIWGAVAQRLNGRVACHCLDLNVGETMARMAASVLARCPPTFALGGFSMGGHVAMEIMRQAPNRVTRLMLVNTRAAVDSQERLRVRDADEALIQEDGWSHFVQTLPSRWLHPEVAQHPELRELIEAMANRVGPQIRRQQVQALRTRIDSRPFLSAIACPTLVIGSAQDHANPPVVQQEIVQLIPDAELCLLQDCGHMTPLEQPAELAALIGDFLSCD